MRLGMKYGYALGALSLVTGLAGCYSGHDPATVEGAVAQAEWTAPGGPSAVAAPLRFAVGDHAALGRVHAAASGSLNVFDHDGRSFVDVIVTTTNTGGSLLQSVRSTGLNVAAVHARANQVMGSVPIDALEALGRVPGVERVEPARPMTTLLDLSVPSGSTSMSMNVTHGPDSDGTGVVVGVVDTGIDYMHNDFRDTEGRTRIRAIWDQTDCANTFPPTDAASANFGCGGTGETTGDPSTYSPCGSVYDSARINCAIDAIEAGTDPAVVCGMPHQDTDSHGTHVASTAAGNGRGTGAPGVAPNADLIIVKFDFDNVCDRNSSIAIIEGVRYIFETSGSQPASVNLSLGSDAGPHTGETAEETSLSALAAPGKIAVFAAGNAARTDASGACSSDSDCGVVGVLGAGTPCGDDGLCSCGSESLCINSVFGYPIHGSGVITEDETSVFTFNVPAGYEVYPAGDNYLVFDLWYGRTLDANASVRVWSPGARKPVSFSATQSSCKNARRDGRVCVIHTDYDYWEIAAGSDNELWIQIDDGGGFAPAAGTWRVEITGQTIPGGSTPYDSWLLSSYNYSEAYHRYHTSTSCDDDADCAVVPGTFCDADESLCFRRADNNMTVGSPGTAHDVLAVAAYTTRSTWLDFEMHEQGYGVSTSQVWYYGPMPTNDLAFFSSRGGTRHPALSKPEIAAPGAGIEAAFSHWTYQAERAEFLADGTPYFYPGRIPNAGHSIGASEGFDATAILQGTSMATPHATGGVAVLLQRNPTLTVSDIRTIFAATATPAGSANDWGAGRFHVDRALASMSCGSDMECDDGVDCNGPETCNISSGACLAGVPAVAGTDCSDGEFCNGEETCDGMGACSATPEPCDDPFYCNGVEVCNEETDTCDPGSVVDCDDGNPCTFDGTCNEVTRSCPASENEPDDTSCADELWCNGNETCVGGSCGAPDECTGATETCNEASDTCSSCSDVGASCSNNGDCCSGLRCRGGRGGKTCRV